MNCFGGSTDNVYIPITFEQYDRIRSASYKYEANKEQLSVVVNDNIKIEIVKNDISKEKVGAIAHWSNSKLAFVGGVANAIKKAGTP